MPLEILFPRNFNDLELKGLMTNYAAVKDYFSFQASDASQTDSAPENDDSEIFRVFQELRVNLPRVDRKNFARLVAMVAEVVGVDQDAVLVALARRGVVAPTEDLAEEPKEQDEEEQRDWRGMVFGQNTQDPKKNPKKAWKKIAEEIVDLVGQGLEDDERNLLGREVLSKYRL
jgi:hypothetical protein